MRRCVAQDETGPIGQAPGLPLANSVVHATATASNGSRYTILGGSYGSRLDPSPGLLVLFRSTLPLDAIIP
jgi:hypothetical protein